MFENVMVAQIKKFKKQSPSIFNFASGRSLPTHENVYGSVSAGREIWMFRIIFFQKLVPLWDQT